MHGTIPGLPFRENPPLALRRPIDLPGPTRPDLERTAFPRVTALKPPVHPPPAPLPPTRLLLLPTLNEEAGLERTLEDLRSVTFEPGRARPTLLVIDGRSRDRTVEVARRWGVEVLEQTTRGKGAAVREGLAWAAAHAFDSVGVIDADGTYPASALPAMFNLLENGRDLVVGVRRTAGTALRSLRDIVHRIGNGLLNYAAAQASGAPILDICSGFWGVRTSALESFTLESDGFEIESELFVKGFRNGLRVAQFPVAYRDRTGEAKLHAVRDGARILLSIFRYSFRRGRPMNGSAPREEPGTPPAESLNPLLLALNAERVVLLSAPERASEADLVRKNISAAVPQAEVVTAVVGASAPGLSNPIMLSSSNDPLDGHSQKVVVALPSPDRFPTAPGTLLVGIPRTQRFLRVSAAPPGEESRVDLSLTRSDGFRPERAHTGRRRAWFILGATLEPSWTQRELALLEANAQDSAIQVYRRVLPSPSPRPRSATRISIARFLSPGER
jgi:glycosyl transferase family 2